MSRKYYAARMPRGFSNEIETYSFPTIEMRRKFLEDNDVGGGPTEPYPITAREAMKNVNYRGDAITKSYNSDIYPAFKGETNNKNDCEWMGGEWVESYRRGKITVHAYCRIVRRY